jgi:hypothetical protein
MLLAISTIKGVTKMAGKWMKLKNKAPFNVNTMLLLTDGSVMCQDGGGSGPSAGDIGTPNWWKLTPDKFGNYHDGTWSPLATGPNSPLFYASALLRDGRVFVAGGEYNAGAPVDLLAAEIYDPVADAWTSIATPGGWTNIGDASCCVLPDGRVLLGNINDNRTAIYDPVADTWSAGALKNNPRVSEETWTLLPDESILTADCFGHPQTEKYVIAANKWVKSGTTPVDLVKADTDEIGPAILLPDARVFAIGASGHTALYTMPDVAKEPGTWSAGPDFPAVGGIPIGAEDAPACLMPNGHVLCVAGPINGDYLPPTYFFEFNPKTNHLHPVQAPGNNSRATFFSRMMLLPSGHVMFANGTNDVEIYMPGDDPESSWRPHVSDVPHHLLKGQTYELKGRQLNGLSQAVSYGDDATMATNYPLVQIRHEGSNVVHYCRTHDHSTMGVATGSIPQSTKFDVPLGIPLGKYHLTTVANGIHSEHVSVTVA